MSKDTKSKQPEVARLFQQLVGTALIPVENTIETMRLLVVSREMAALHPLWSIVESNAWHVELAASAWEAMDRVQSGVAPHILILDLPRGDSDSLHILRWLRRLRPELPIILLCHAADAAHRKRCDPSGSRRCSRPAIPGRAT